MDNNFIAGTMLIVTIVVIAIRVFIYAKDKPTDYWITYQEQLEKDSRWYRCQDWNGGPGCDWPDSCRPGDCRRPGNA